MDATATVQMNTRINAELKARGDAALAYAGYSPSQAVRALWAIAASHAGEPAAIQQLLGSRTDDARRAERDRRLAAIQQGPGICEQFMSTHCAAIQEKQDRHNEPSFDELRELAWNERLQERGLA